MFKHSVSLELGSSLGLPHVTNLVIGFALGTDLGTVPGVCIVVKRDCVSGC